MTKKTDDNKKNTTEMQGLASFTQLYGTTLGARQNNKDEKKKSEQHKKTEKEDSQGIAEEIEVVHSPKKEKAKKKTKSKNANNKKMTVTHPKSSSGLSSLLKGKKRLEDTHTRRTFLVRNDLLDRLDEYAEKADNISFKTDFINYIIEEALNRLEDENERQG